MLAVCYSGCGKLLRVMELTKGVATLEATTSLVTSPAYAIRGHQLGFRNRANSWDAWDTVSSSAGGSHGHRYRKSSGGTKA